MGLADNTVGRDAVKRTLLSNSHRKTQCSLGPPSFSTECRLDNQQSHSIDRRTFLAMGLAVPFGIRPAFYRRCSPEFFPVSIDRCVVVQQDQIANLAKYHRRCSPGFVPVSLDRCVVVPQDEICRSPTCHCQVRRGTQCDLEPNWWLLISLFEGCLTQLTVIQPISALPQSSGLSGLLAARIRFRLYVLQRRGAFADEFDKRQFVQQVNHQILNAMKSLPG